MKVNGRHVNNAVCNPTLRNLESLDSVSPVWELVPFPLIIRHFTTGQVDLSKTLALPAVVSQSIVL